MRLVAVALVAALTFEPTLLYAQAGSPPAAATPDKKQAQAPDKKQDLAPDKPEGGQPGKPGGEPAKPAAGQTKKPADEAPGAGPKGKEPGKTPEPGTTSKAGQAPTTAAPDTWGSGAPPANDGEPNAEPEAPLPDKPPPRGSLPSDDTASSRSPADTAVRYTLENIEVRGNTRTRSRVVLRYVPFKAGDIINVDDPELELTRYRLLGTGFFRDVQFSLKKGSQRGYVVLVIDVVERNTVIVNNLWMGLSADADASGNKRPLTAYAGLDVAETNLAGTGITLGSAIGLAQDQLALRVRFLDPAFLGGHWMTNGTLLYNDARDFFGTKYVLVDDPSQLKCATIDCTADFAVARYKRFGGALGVGRDLSVATQLWLTYRVESIDAQLPLAASEERGLTGPDAHGVREPIDFMIRRGKSVLSTLRGTLQYDSRDQPLLPTRGWFATFTGELGLAPIGSDYSYQRFDIAASHWWKLPWDHVVRLEMFGGAISGNAPFFERYYVGDFSDFLPGRVLGLNFDRRPPPNFLGTDIQEVRYGDFAAKLGGEYRIPLYRGHRSVYGIDFFTSAGIYGVATRRDITDPPRGYKAGQRIPIDLTGNIGFRMDTSAGGFVFAFSNVLGFIPVRRKVEK
jgi:outer membrane protein assembly factor BamA